MRYNGHLLVRVEASFPAAVAAAAKAEGMTRSEFVRRAVKQALPARARPSNDDDSRPPPGAPAGALPAAA